MRTKNLIIAIAAIALAISSAFSIRKADMANNARVWIQHDPPDPYECELVPLECLQHIDGLLCQVSVVKKYGPSETVYAYGNGACTIQLRHTWSTNHAGEYDAGEGDRPFDVANFNPGWY